MLKAYLKSFIRCAVIPITMAAGCGGGLPSGNGSNGAGGACAPVAALTNLLPASFGVDCCAYGNPVSDGENVYFSAVSALYRVPIFRGSIETLYAGPLGGFYAAAGGTVAWVVGSVDQPTGITVKNASGLHDVTLPSGAVPSWGNILVDTAGNVFFEVSLPTGGRARTWRWNPESNVAGEMPGVGMPDAGAGTNLYWADRGQVIWSNNVDGPSGGIYATDISTGTAHQLTDSSTAGFGGLVGVDAANVYGTSNICPSGACPFTVNGVSRDGGAPFVAYQSDTAYWTNGLQVDDSGLYWIDWSTRAVYHAKQTDAAATVVADLSPSSSIPSQFGLDACNVYWFDADQAGVPRLLAIAK